MNYKEPLGLGPLCKFYCLKILKKKHKFNTSTFQAKVEQKEPGHCKPFFFSYYQQFCMHEIFHLISVDQLAE